MRAINGWHNPHEWDARETTTVTPAGYGVRSVLPTTEPRVVEHAVADVDEPYLDVLAAPDPGPQPDPDPEPEPDDDEDDDDTIPDDGDDDGVPAPDPEPEPEPAQRGRRRT